MINPFTEQNLEKVRTSKAGNRLEEYCNFAGDRYKFDFKYCTSEDGWIQYDTTQDAWYFGVWVHPSRRETVTYCEGDITRVICDSEESFQAEIKNMNEFYGTPPPAYIGFDLDKGTRTEFYDEKSAFGRLIPVGE